MSAGCGEYLHQIGGHRPTPELAKLKVPGVERLYLTGTAINVSSVSGAGRATAIKICEDLRIDFDRLTRIAHEVLHARRRRTHRNHDGYA